MTPVSPTAQVTATPTSPGEAAFDLSAVVLDAGTGQFVAGATVDVLDASGRVVASFVTDGRGPAIVELPPGDYTLRAHAPCGGTSTDQQVSVPTSETIVLVIQCPGLPLQVPVQLPAFP
jgi:Carboxypeptidase regulatory-like domain